MSFRPGLQPEFHEIPDEYMKAISEMIVKSKDSLHDSFMAILDNRDVSTKEDLSSLADNIRSVYDSPPVGVGRGNRFYRWGSLSR